MSSWSWWVKFIAPKDIIFKETINALNTLRINTEKIDENNGIIEAKKKDLWGGDQHVKISMAPYQEGCSFYIEVSQRQIWASSRCGFTGINIIKIMGERLAPLGFDKMVELAPTSFDKPSPPSMVQNISTSAQPAQTPPPPPPPPPYAAQTCPTCGGQLTFIQQYDRWYCYNCKKYP